MKFELKSVEYYEDKLKTAKNKWIRQMFREKLNEAKELKYEQKTTEGN